MDKKIIVSEEIKNKYMPPEGVINEIEQLAEQESRENHFTYDNDYVIRHAISKIWNKILSKEEQSMIYKDVLDCLIKILNKECKVYDVKIGNGYFIFEFGDNSVAHFKIKELPGWLFGVWLSYDENIRNNITIQWFCQQELWLNKFKPSNSTICCKTTICIDDFIASLLEGNDDVYSVDFYEIIDNINFMKKYPYLAAYRDITGEDLNTNYITKKYAKRFVKKENKQNTHRINMAEKLEKTLANIVVKEVNKIEGIEHIKLIDENEDGFSVSPRYHLEVIPKDSCNLQELYDKCWDVIRDTQNKIRDTKKYKKYCCFDSVSCDVTFVKEDNKNE